MRLLRSSLAETATTEFSWTKALLGCAKKIPVNSVEQTKLDLLADPSLTADTDERDKFTAAGHRLARLMAPGGDKPEDTVPDGVHHFSVKEFPGYFHDDDIPFWLQPDVHVQRHHLSGLCYMHAPAVAQYYNIWFHALRNNNTNTKHSMLDLAKYIRNHFSPAQLSRHIFDNDGDDSRLFLDAILQPGSFTIASGLAEIGDNLHRYGPGLVSLFKVYNDFHDNHSQHHHAGTPRGKEVGHHAMVVLAVRQDPEGKRHFLLQNWWGQKQFVEVDEEYMKRCGATVYFIETPQTGIPEQLPTNTGHFFETEATDKPERVCGECPPCLPPSPAL
eukprot:m.104233 g.104233  ORF g.104233 m.104233 type:complete len:331 (+) comp15634_c0_seq1:345-1337(+)